MLGWFALAAEPAGGSRRPGSPLSGAAQKAPHVLRLTPYYYLPGRLLTRRELQYEPVGGMQVQIAQITEELDALGVRQVVVLPRRPGLPPQMRIGEHSMLRLLRLPVVPLRTRSKGYAGLLVSWCLAVTVWCAIRRIRNQRHDIALIHVHCSELPWTFILAVIAERLLRRPLVLTTHCSAIATFHPETLAGRMLIRPARAAERFAVRRAAAVIVLTDRIRATYLGEGLVSPDRVHVIPDGVRLSQFRPKAPASACEEDGRAADPLVLYCGRFAPEKGWADFVRAAHMLTQTGRSARYLMCGEGNELDRCRRLVTRSGLASRVELPGHLDREAVAKLMRATAVVVVPSKHEELGGTVLEALASGAGVVVTRVGGLPEVVDDGVNGLVVPVGRADLIARAIARLLDDPLLRLRLGAAGAAGVAGYDASLAAGAHRRLYSCLADPPCASVQAAPQPLGTAQAAAR